MRPQVGDRVLVTDVEGLEWPAEVVGAVREAQGKGGGLGWFLVEVRVAPSQRYPRADERSTPWPIDSIRSAAEDGDR